MSYFCLKCHVKKKSQSTNVKKPLHNCICCDNTVTSFYESAAEEFYPIQVQSFLSIFTKLQKEIISSIMSVCLPAHPQPAWNNSAPTGWIFMKFDI
jgi:hypothetical protein